MTRTRAHAAVVALLLASAAAAAQNTLPHLVVIAPVANMYRSPSADADVVSQTVFGSDVIRVDATPGWEKIRTGDSYTGWVRLGRLKAQHGAKLYASSGRVARVSSLFASLYREPDLEKHRPVITLPFEASLEITGEKVNPDGDLWLSARLPDGATAWVQSGDVSFETRPLSVAAAIELGRRFLGLPYHWGGTSSFGFDCSGFTQMLMRNRGVTMPRDTGPQARWDGLVPVQRAELQPGDLLYFGKTPQKINHTGMYIGNGEFIHATRHEHPVVQIGRLDDAPWTTLYITARRLK